MAELTAAEREELRGQAVGYPVRIPPRPDLVLRLLHERDDLAEENETRRAVAEGQAKECGRLRAQLRATEAELVRERARAEIEDRAVDFWDSDHDRAIAAAVEAEREACAEAVEEWAQARGSFAVECERDRQPLLADRWRTMAGAAQEVAASIRARAGKETP
jgi:hypothetical protein